MYLHIYSNATLQEPGQAFLAFHQLFIVNGASPRGSDNYDPGSLKVDSP